MIVNKKLSVYSIYICDSLLQPTYDRDPKSSLSLPPPSPPSTVLLVEVASKAVDPEVIYFCLIWIAPDTFSPGLPWCLPDSSDGKESSCNAGDLGSIPGSERSPEEGLAAHCRVFAWGTPWTEEPGGLQSWAHRVGHDFRRRQCVLRAHCFPLCS